MVLKCGYTKNDDDADRMLSTLRTFLLAFIDQFLSRDEGGKRLKGVMSVEREKGMRCEILLLSKKKREPQKESRWGIKKLFFERFIDAPFVTF